MAKIQQVLVRWRRCGQFHTTGSALPYTVNGLFVLSRLSGFEQWTQLQELLLVGFGCG